MICISVPLSVYMRFNKFILMMFVGDGCKVMPLRMIKVVRIQLMTLYALIPRSLQWEERKSRHLISRPMHAAKSD